MKPLYRVEVRGEWGGAVGGWRPAFTGTENQTGLSDEEASAFTSRREAQQFLESFQNQRGPILTAWFRIVAGAR